MEPTQGFEPWTYGLQNRCSTAELSRPKQAASFASLTMQESSPQIQKSWHFPGLPPLKGEARARRFAYAYTV